MAGDKMITHRISTMKELPDKSEDQFRKLFELNRAIMLLIDPDSGDIIQANQAASDFYGWSLSELRTMRIQQINTLPPETVMDEINKTLSAGSLHWVFQHRRADGSIRDVDVFSSKIELAEKNFLCSIVHDTTERKRAEAMLQESEAQYRLLFESASDALFLIAIDTGDIVNANDKASELYGYDRQELLTKKSWDLSAEAEETRRLTLEARTVPGLLLHIPLRFHRKKDGAEFPVEITSRIFPLNQQDVLLVAIRDITDRQREEAEKSEIEARNRQLQKFESLNRMARAIAHNFNNQLQVVIGNLEIAMEDLPQHSFTADKVAAALKAAHKAAQISGSMVSYRGENAGNRQPQNLSRICRQSLALLQAAVPKNVTIETHFPDSGPVVHADANQIQQMLTILATNAWEAFDRNQGMIRLTVKTVDRSDIPLSKRFPVNWQPQESVYACLEVIDTGSGIMCCDTDNLFDPFFTTKFIGRGMGLSVVLGIVQAHGGAITVESKPGSGSVFRVFLPVSA